MRIQIATQYFPPEVTAASARLHAFASGLAQRGHQVEVVCGVPNHPEGVIGEGYRGRRSVRAEEDGFTVSRVWVYARPSKRARTRIANYASFLASASLGRSAVGRPDVILASSPPLSVGVLGMALGKKHRAPWVMDVRDLWPEVAVLMGEIGEGRALRAVERLERRLYRSAAAVVTVTEPFRASIEERGGEGRVKVIPNGTTPLYLEQGSTETGARRKGTGGAPFVWCYAGNLGKAQGLEAAIEAAGLLGEGYRLELIGEGAMRTDLQTAAAALPPGSTSFRGAVPAAEAAAFMRNADALLVPLAGWPGLSGFVPSKLYDSCAVGRPVIVATPGEANRLASEAGAALAIPPGNAEALAAAVRSLAASPKLRDELSARGRDFAIANQRDLGVDRLEELLEGVVDGP